LHEAELVVADLDGGQSTGHVAAAVDPDAMGQHHGLRRRVAVDDDEIVAPPLAGEEGFADPHELLVPLPVDGQTRIDAGMGEEVVSLPMGERQPSEHAGQFVPETVAQRLAQGARLARRMRAANTENGLASAIHGPEPQDLVGIVPVLHDLQHHVLMIAGEADFGDPRDAEPVMQQGEGLIGFRAPVDIVAEPDHGHFARIVLVLDASPDPSVQRLQMRRVRVAVADGEEDSVLGGRGGVLPGLDVDADHGSKSTFRAANRGRHSHVAGVALAYASLRRHGSIIARIGVAMDKETGAADRWDPEAYLGFAALRERPAQELLQRILLDAPTEVGDLGCGPGNSTAYLAARFPAAKVTGLDNSASMLAKARSSGVRARWIEADIGDWRPTDPVDLIYSNAALHWLDDHDALMPRLFGHLAPGGALAVQMPRNFAAPSHTCLRETAADGPWAEALQAVLRPAPVRRALEYQRLLAPLARAVDAWETTYVQRLTGADAVLTWVRGTALTPVMSALDDATYKAFEAAYAARLRNAYPPEPDGATLFPFTRVFFVAYRS